MPPHHRPLFFHFFFQLPSALSSHIPNTTLTKPVIKPSPFPPLLLIIRPYETDFWLGSMCRSHESIPVFVPRPLSPFSHTKSAGRKLAGRAMCRLGDGWDEEFRVTICRRLSSRRTRQVRLFGHCVTLLGPQEPQWPCLASFPHHRL
ncbi:hypothetical protein CTAM01_02869 [Colletotrichum tamarilloi]|uniref:Secreted protein n=1 Tax=Colletotrichum tamarilloi TaxID=1209934 RepID=A0ABQ9RMM9_9PEZI|nr:uncharacterized protein CTAM01_02869 [Colletotrichum tamarilloi]KAK1507757.1 hypothetical protein CTAM01_02869 [Colletotrichum tamarilloi]